MLVNTLVELKRCVKVLEKEPRLAHDTETFGPNKIGGLFPFHGSRAFSHIFSTATDEYYFNFNKGGIDPKHKKLLQPIFDDPKKIIFYVNALFDATISHFDGLEFKNRVVDCPSIARIEYNKHGKNEWDKESFLSLKYLAKHYDVLQKNDLVVEYIKEHKLYHEDRCQFTGKLIPRYDLVPIELMYEYGCDDARSTYDIGIKIIKNINYKDTLNSYIDARGNSPKMIDVAQNEIKLTSVLIDMKIEGMKCWVDYTKKAIKHETKLSEKLHKEIDALTGGINTNSGKQLAEYLTSKGVEVPRKEPTETAFKRMDSWLAKAKILKEKGNVKGYHQAIEKAEDYKKGNPITDKKTLKKLMKQNPKLDFLAKITRAKEADKKLSTYYLNFIKIKDADDVIHCGLHQEKGKLGRFSSSNPNLQNLEKVYNEEFCVRKSFIADEGYRLFFADYDQQEMILMLDQSEEMSVIQKLLSGEFSDFYLATAAILKEVLGISIERKQAKDTALALAYGKGNEALAKDFGYIMPNATKDEVEAGKKRASAFKNEFFRALPKLKKYTKRIEASIKREGKIHNAAGRVLYFGRDEAYKGLNGDCQSSAADVTKKAMVDVYGFLNGFESRLSLCVHDELVFNIKIGEEEKVIPLIRKAMVEAYPHKHIPLTVGFDYSPLDENGISSWGNKIAYKEGM